MQTITQQFIDLAVKTARYLDAGKISSAAASAEKATDIYVSSGLSSYPLTYGKLCRIEDGDCWVDSFNGRTKKELAKIEAQNIIFRIGQDSGLDPWDNQPRTEYAAPKKIVDLYYAVAAIGREYEDIDLFMGLAKIPEKFEKLIKDLKNEQAPDGKIKWLEKGYAIVKEMVSIPKQTPPYVTLYDYYGVIYCLKYAMEEGIKIIEYAGEWLQISHPNTAKS